MCFDVYLLSRGLLMSNAFGGARRFPERAPVPRARLRSAGGRPFRGLGQLLFGRRRPRSAVAARHPRVARIDVAIGGAASEDQKVHAAAPARPRVRVA